MSWPLTTHKTIPFVGQDEAGVQVSIVSSGLQAELTASGVRGDNGFMNWAEVREVSMAVLKVKTTGAVTETPDAPLVGTLARSVGWAWADGSMGSAPARASHTAMASARRILKGNGLFRARMH